MIELPVELKKDILEFCKRYEELAKPRKIKITCPKIELTTKVVWCSDNKIEFVGNIDDKLDFKLYDVSPEISEINRNIKKFIDDTVIWGKKHFKNKDWLWECVLWNYRPEVGETHKTLKIKWIKNYECEEWL